MVQSGCRFLAGAVGVCVIAVMAACAGAEEPGAKPFADADVEAIRALEAQYVTAWRAGDQEGVLATLADDVVLMPPNREPVTGRDAIVAFWWPDDGSTTTITRYESTLDGIEGGGDTAWARGGAELEFVYEKDGERSEVRSRSVSLTAYRRAADGGWRIAARMWHPR